MAFLIVCLKIIFEPWQWPHSPRLMSLGILLVSKLHTDFYLRQAVDDLIRAHQIFRSQLMSRFQPKSNSNDQLGILEYYQSYRMSVAILKYSFSQGAQSNTGSGCPSVLNTQLLSGTISSSLNSRYRYFSLIESMNWMMKSSRYEKLTSLPGKNWKSLVKIKLDMIAQDITLASRFWYPDFPDRR